MRVFFLATMDDGGAEPAGDELVEGVVLEGFLQFHQEVEMRYLVKEGENIGIDDPDVAFVTVLNDALQCHTQ